MTFHTKALKTGENIIPKTDMLRMERRDGIFGNEQPDSLVPGCLSQGSIMVGLGVGEGIVA